MPSRFHEILRFLLVGGGCFLLDYGLLYVLTEYAGLYYLLSSGISFSVSVFVNYRLCLIYVFHGASAETRRAKVLFFGSSIAGLVLNQLLMWVLVDGLSVYYMLAKIIAAGIVTVWNYVLKRRALRKHGNAGILSVLMQQHTRSLRSQHAHRRIAPSPASSGGFFVPF